MSINPPQHPSDHPDRIIDCEFAMEPEFQALAHRAEAAGWSADDVSTAMANLAIAQIKAVVAEQRTDADVKLAVQLIRTMKGKPKTE